MSFWLTATILTGIFWGVGTFALGRAAREASPPLLTAIYNFLALIIFIVLFAWSQESDLLSTSASKANSEILHTVLAGILGGISFAIGLTVVSIALSKGRAGIVGPIASTCEVLLPFIFVLIARELPNQFALFGILLLMPVPWLITQTKVSTTVLETTMFKDITLAIIAGSGFGGYYIGLLLAPDNAPLLAMAFIQATSGIAMLIVHIVTKRSWTIPRSTWRNTIIFLVCEIGGALTIRFAFTHGSPAVVSTVASIIYVASLLAMAFYFNRERFSRIQLAGFGLTFTGIALVVLNS